ncbi:MAG TPA: S8/S53 family peptidase [Saprospiraceae bacterium]|nr:S8 family peptidase [Lewinellaceae bacterium]HRX28661.1 S8/S53 family peptidase [Saprospiraceae bacterium]
MKQITILLISFILSSNILSQDTDHYSKNELIVKFNQKSVVDLRNCLSNNKFENVELDFLNSKHELYKIKSIGSKKISNTYILEFKTNQDIIDLVEIYDNTGLFEYVEPNFIGSGGGKQGLVETFPTDTYFYRQWGLYNDGSFSLASALNDADIDMELAWDIEQGSSSITIAVLDSGLKLNHPEFNGRVWENSNEESNNLDDDNNGYIDDFRGWDFANNDNDPTDDYGHGTNVTGIIGANANNNIGYAGVDWNSKLMICKILDQNNLGYYSWWVEAIYYAVDNGAKVINMSVGGSSFSNALQSAINYAHDNGVTIVACMMNENNSVTYYPAGFQNTIAVGSINPDNKRSSPFFWNSASGSNYGNHIDVVAPGNFIYGLSYQSNTNYNTYWGGTSQATPLVTGLAALLLAQDANRTPDDIRTIIRSTAEDQVGSPSEDIKGFDKYYGYGRINAHKALLHQTVGISDNRIEDKNLMMYPNPTSGFLVLRSDEGISNVKIHNISGKEIYKKQFETEQNFIEIDISNLSSGMYIINVSDKNDKNIQSKKLFIE